MYIITKPSSIYSLALFKILFQCSTEFFGIFDELLFALFNCLFAGCARYESNNLINSIQKFLNGTSDFSVSNIWETFQLYIEKNTRLRLVAQLVTGQSVSTWPRLTSQFKHTSNVVSFYSGQCIVIITKGWVMPKWLFIHGHGNGSHLHIRYRGDLFLGNDTVIAHLYPYTALPRLPSKLSTCLSLA